MSWRVEFSPKAKKQAKKLDARTRQGIYSWLHEHIDGCDDPRAYGHNLHGSKDGGYWTYRIGDYRAICDIQYGKLVVLAMRVEHRSEAYAQRRHE